MTNFNDFLNEQMKDPEFKAEWDALDPEFSVIEAMLKARKESGNFRSARVLHRPTSANWNAAMQTRLFVPCSGLLPGWE